MSAAPPAREASVVIVDTSHHMRDHMGIAKNVCSSLIQQKFVFAPRDIVGIVAGGTSTTLNRLNAAAPSEYQNLTLARPVMAPNADFLKAIDTMTCNADPAVPFDLLDAVVVAVDAIHEAVADKKYGRRIFLISTCAGAVKRKDQLSAIIDGLKARGIALVVIGVDFDDDEDDDAASANIDWAKLTVKQQNEKVLHFMCAQLGQESLVVAVHDAVSALGALRKKHLAQRAYCKCVLDIGDVRIPVAMYVKALKQTIPSFGKLSAKGEEQIVFDRRYFSVRKPDAELDHTERVKAYRYGRSAIPVNDVDVAEMKFKSERGISVLGFVPSEQIPLHILQGGSKMIAPVHGDTIGAGTLAAFVTAMAELRRAMLVRFVRCTNANPVLGVCYPSAKGNKQVLYYANLPFAEDLRHFTFRRLDNISGTEDEKKAIASLIDSMDLDKFEAKAAAAAPGGHPSPSPAAPPGADSPHTVPTVSSSAGSAEHGAGASAKLLSIKETFDPALQHYYAAVRERYLRPDAPVAGLPPQVSKTSTNWNAPGSVLEPLLASSAPARKRVREMLPPPAPKAAGAAAKGSKVYWFQKTGDVNIDDPVAKANRAEGAAHYLASATPGATTPGAGTGTPSTPHTPSTTAADVENALRVGADVTEGTAMHVTTVDPVNTFLALVDRKGEDHVARAIHELQEAILQLLKVTVGPQYYSRCADSVRVMRRICVREGEPGAFNSFLLHLMLTTKMGAHAAFWTTDIVTAGVRPIPKSECPESDLSDDAARTFFDDRAPAPRVVLDDEPDEPSLFDDLE
jgi:ATP-dependent DNA helicase 2 subunit 2